MDVHVLASCNYFTLYCHQSLDMNKGLFGMAPELNSSNSKQFSCQTDQLQNSMELQNSRAVVHFFLEFWSTSFAALETSVMNLDMELG